MDDDIDRPFSFDLHLGKRAGLFIEMSPAFLDARLERRISLDERTFFVIEMFLKARMLNPDLYSHYGVNIVQSTDWNEALLDLSTYSEALGILARFDDSRWIEGGYVEVHEEFSRRWGRTRAGIRKVAVQLNAWTASWSCPTILIHGI